MQHGIFFVSKNKGFTLIELLAVIVILAIIALIATPTIIRIIDNTRKETLKDSVYGITKAGKLLYSNDLLDGINEEVSFIYTDGVETSSIPGKKLDYNGVKPKSGNVIINSEGEVAVAIYDGKYCAKKMFGIGEIMVSERPKEQCMSIYSPEEWFAFDPLTGTIEGFVEEYDEIINEIDIPPTIDGVAVKIIGSGAFDGQLLKWATIPEGVITIEDWAFYAIESPTVNIPNSVTSIGWAAFYEGKFSTIKIGTGLATLDEYVFNRNPQITTVIVDKDNPNFKSVNNNSLYSKDGKMLYVGTRNSGILPGTEIIGGEAFTLYDIPSITIPEGVVSIGTYAFGENKLTSIVIPNSVTNIEYNAFWHNQLTSISVGTGLTTMKRGLFSYNNLTTVTIPNNITTIENSVFQENPLTDVFIGTGLSTFKYDSFGSSGTTKFTVDTNNPYYQSIDNSIYTKDGTSIVKGGATYTIAAGTITIADYAFYNMGLTEITIPSSVTTIGNYAFQKNKLTSLIIPTGVTKINNSTFAENLLTSVTIPSSVTNIGTRAFANNKFTSISIPNSVTTVGDYAFELNPLISINIGSGLGSITYKKFDDSLKTVTTITIDANNLGFKSVNNAIYTKDGSTILIGTKNSGIAEGTLTISEYAFSSIDLSGITIPSSITTIGNYSFSGNQLTSVTIPNSVTSIGNSAFSDNQLTNVTISSSVTSIGNSAFYNNQITNVTIPNSVTTIGTSSFYNNPIVNASIGTGLTSIGTRSIDNRNLSSVVVDASNPNFKSVNNAIYTKNGGTIIMANKNGMIESGTQIIGDYALFNLGLTGVSIPNSVTTIGTRAISQNALTSVTIPNSVITIKDYSFYLNGLTSITIPSSVTTIMNSAFDANNIDSGGVIIQKSEGTVSLGNRAFGNVIPIYQP